MPNLEDLNYFTRTGGVSLPGIPTGLKTLLLRTWFEVTDVLSITGLRVYKCTHTLDVRWHLELLANNPPLEIVDIYRMRNPIQWINTSHSLVEMRSLRALTLKKVDDDEAASFLRNLAIRKDCCIDVDVLPEEDFQAAAEPFHQLVACVFTTTSDTSHVCLTLLDDRLLVSLGPRRITLVEGPAGSKVFGMETRFS